MNRISIFWMHTPNQLPMLVYPSLHIPLHGTQNLLQHLKQMPQPKFLVASSSGASSLHNRRRYSSAWGWPDLPHWVCTFKSCVWVRTYLGPMQSSGVVKPDLEPQRNVFKHQVYDNCLQPFQQPLSQTMLGHPHQRITLCNKQPSAVPRLSSRQYSLEGDQNIQPWLIDKAGSGQ